MIVKFIKFFAVGLLNTFVDLGILNLLFFTTGLGHKSGALYSLFKAISFSAAVINSYYFNKLWVFKGQGDRKKVAQFSTFLIISIIGGLINVSVATIVYTSVPVILVGPHLWPTVGALCGSLTAFTWNFLGYNYFVFRGKKIVVKSEK
jgi:putative flippase GtrA